MTCRRQEIVVIVFLWLVYSLDICNIILNLFQHLCMILDKSVQTNTRRGIALHIEFCPPANIAELLKSTLFSLVFIIEYFPEN